MRLLFCCEFYYPSVGGVQEVMRQIAERLVKRGHDVTVATTRLADRDFDEYNGVRIAEFGVTGNLVHGIEGEVGRYRAFVKSFHCDAILVKAAQQWTFDALWPILDDICARKVFIPCGFSGLYEPTYAKYFCELPDILRKLDHLIFYAENYRDVEFVRQHQIGNLSILANGASEIEFCVTPDPAFRSRHGIPEDSVVLLTVGSFTGVKGHQELLEAFVLLKTKGRHVTLILNGNKPPKPSIVTTSAAGVEQSPPRPTGLAGNGGPQRLSVWVRLSRVHAAEGLSGVTRRIWRRLTYVPRRCFKLSRRTVQLGRRAVQVWSEEGAGGVRRRILMRIGTLASRTGLLPRLPARIRVLADPMAFWFAEAGRPSAEKLLIVSDYPRAELVQAYMAADLFVFASNVEYSPLVLFEAVAAGTPFLSVPVGNAEEIARWTGGGLICPAPKDSRGYTRVSPTVLATEIAHAIEDPGRLRALGRAGRESWKKNYTWDAIAGRYEKILRGQGTFGSET